MGPPTTRDHAIELRGVRAQYGEKTILAGIDFAVEPGEVFAVLGPSGCGKTTLLRIMIGLLQATEGEVKICGHDISALDEDEMNEVRRRLGMLFQYSALFNSLTIGENVALPLREFTDLSEEAIRTSVRMKLALVGLAHTVDLMPAQLSGGMRKRAALARAIALDPEVVFFDEPTTGLDPITAAGIDEIVRELNRAFRTTMVLVTHDIPSALGTASRIVMLDRGRIAALGTPREIERSEDPWVKDFLARRFPPDAPDEAFFGELILRGDA